jgi:organic radical activating enzyme
MSITKSSVKVIKIPLMETFYSIQGEGYHQGKAAYFIRLAGCDVGCPWCDVKESWTTDTYPRIESNKLAEKAAVQRSGIAIVTGGEPLMYDLTDLTFHLNERRINTHLETSGTYPLTGNWNWICFSPKKFKTPLPEFFNMADELKIIIVNHSDFEWAQGFADKVRPDCKKYLQPEWSRSNKVLPKIVEFVKQNPEWEISLQIHKYLDVP